ncbi:MAG: hypothetical protein ACJAXX_000058 [Roseivirga sp.]|jgi:hypothetical protein
MKKLILMSLILIQFGCQSNSTLEETLIAEINSHQETISFYESIMGTWLSSESENMAFVDSLTDDRLFFYFSESQCMDCVYFNLSLIKQHLLNDLSKAKKTHIIGYYQSDRDFSATLNRYGLIDLGVNIKNEKNASFESDYPVFMVKSDKGTVSFEYRASISTKSFSEFYLNKIYERL